MRKKIAFDIFLNIVATAIPVFVLQLLILPQLSHYMDENEYGLLVTILALLNVVPATLGNTLNNIRLIFNKEDSSNFRVLLLIMSALNILLISIFLRFYARDFTVCSFILTLTVSILWLYREYYVVAFRIQLNYVNIVLSNLALVLGFGFGYLVFLYSHYWQIIYIIGNLFCLAFIFLKSDLWKEPIRVDDSFKRISGQSLSLFIAGMLGRITTYADKLFIFPTLGGASVSVYYAATLFGKVVSMAITPISSVMLSYLSRVSKKNDSTFRLTFISSAFVCFVGYFVCIAISRPVLMLLYPQFVDRAMQYIWVTTGTMVITALASIINPFVLRYFDMKWQILINAAYVVVYLVLCMPMLFNFGLYGFCIGTLVASIIKVTLMLIIYSRSGKKHGL